MLDLALVFMMHAAPMNSKDSREKSMVLSSVAFVKICRDLKVFPVSQAIV